MHTRIPKHLMAVLAFIAFAVPVRGGTALEPYEQEFLITAYYSPLPDQCCYVTGGYVADKILNGEGHTAADGTAVYPGMIAAPSSYAFGTKIKLSGIGTFTVNDRGGAIQELDGGVHRLDIWAGHGEEGLARALQFGLVRVSGIVYPPAFEQPTTSFSLESLAAPLARLEEFKLDGTTLLSVRPVKSERSLSVMMLQQALRDLGYFRHAVTGEYGDVTSEALGGFLRDFDLTGESSDALSERAAAYLVAAQARKGAENPIRKFVDGSASESVIQEAQRTLRYLGYYDGRTDGEYDDDFAAAILRFQQEHKLAGDWESPGAGRIGPMTMKSLRSLWDQKLTAQRADRLLLLREVDRRIVSSGRTIERFLGEGHNGPSVRMLQAMLSGRGFFPAEKINGNFGQLTKSAVIAYQIDRGIIAHETSLGAGYVGPSTLARLKSEERMEFYRLVRSEGLHAL